MLSCAICLYFCAFFAPLYALQKQKRTAVKGYGRPLRIFSSSEFLHHKTHHEFLRIYQFTTPAKFRQV